MATLITGASMGLGRAMAWECARRGMDLVLAALPGEGLVETAAEIGKAGGVRVLAREIDLTENGAPALLAACGPLPFKTVYPASKAFVLYWSRGLRAELRRTNVRVGVLLPGPMRTNTDVRGRLNKQGWIGRRTTVSVEAAARIAVTGLVKGRAVIVPGAAAKLNRFLMAVVPTPILLFFTGRVFSREAN